MSAYLCWKNQTGVSNLSFSGLKAADEFSVTWFNSQAMQMAQNPYYYQQAIINQMVYSPLFGNMSIILLLVLPLLSMRLLSEEKKGGTDELLFTSPISARVRPS